MNDFDVIVIGGGPAGVKAALAASSAGLSVALFDENAQAGGQVYRAPHAGIGAYGDADRQAGDALRGALGASTVRVFFSHSVWAVTGDYRVDAVGPDGPLHCTARALIVATGTSERVVPFDGWTTPGVIGLAAATILLKAQGVLPGRTTLVAGCGPLLAAVTAKTLAGGGEVAAIADLASSADWLRTLPALATRPDLLARGFAWWRAIRRAGTPRYPRHTIERVEPVGERLRATLAPCDANGCPIAGARRTVEVDCVAVGHGLVPATDITRLLRARHRYVRAAGGWIADTDRDGRTSRERLYVCGDGAGIAGVAAAAAHGTLTGLACASDLGVNDTTVSASAIEVARASYVRNARFGRAMGGLMALREGHVQGIDADTTVCRCEDVTRAEIEAACEAGAQDVNQLKAWTRCGMGPCQGRSCGDVCAELLMRAMPGQTRESVGVFSARTPLRPVAVEALTGTYTYEDIPIPKAAPL